jgi:ERF superfamily
MTTTTEARKTTAARKTTDHAKVHAAEREAADKIEAERVERVETRDNPPPVHLAWSHVMEEVRGLAKTQRNTTPGQNYMFRGIDAVMNAVGPALRKHRVTIVPKKIKVARRDVTTSGGKPSRETTVEVTYLITGPAGDTRKGVSVGEAMDFGDKGTAKAMSVAYRVFLLQALTLPTDETDPDAETYERAPEPTMAQKVANNLPRLTETVKLETNIAWAQERNLLGEQVAGPDGPIALSDLIEIHRVRIANREAQVAHATGATPKQEQEPGA